MDDGPGVHPTRNRRRVRAGHVTLGNICAFPRGDLERWKAAARRVPVEEKNRTWKVNKHTGIEARRTGFWMLPDFGSTAHMIQGATLEAAFVDLQHSSSKPSMSSQIAAYVCLS